MSSKELTHMPYHGKEEREPYENDIIVSNNNLPEDPPLFDDLKEEVNHHKNDISVSFSGGGIRSAAFNSGVSFIICRFLTHYKGIETTLWKRLVI